MHSLGPVRARIERLAAVGLCAPGSCSCSIRMVGQGKSEIPA